VAVALVLVLALAAVALHLRLMLASGWLGQNQPLGKLEFGRVHFEFEDAVCASEFK